MVILLDVRLNEILFLLLLLLLSSHLRIFFNFQRITTVFVYLEIFSVCSKYAETKLHKLLRAVELEISINISQIGKEVSLLLDYNT